MVGELGWDLGGVDYKYVIHVQCMEALYCGHLGDLVKCPVYSGAPLLWTPWGPGEVSCIQWNPSIVDTLGTWSCIERCPHFRGKLIFKKAYLGHSWVPGVSCKRGYTVHPRYDIRMKNEARTIVIIHSISSAEIARVA